MIIITPSWNNYYEYSKSTSQISHHKMTTEEWLFPRPHLGSSNFPHPSQLRSRLLFYQNFTRNRTGSAACELEVPALIWKPPLLAWKSCRAFLIVPFFFIVQKLEILDLQEQAPFVSNFDLFQLKGSCDTNRYANNAFYWQSSLYRGSFVA